MKTLEQEQCQFCHRIGLQFVMVIIIALIVVQQILSAVLVN